MAQITPDKGDLIEIVWEDIAGSEQEGKGPESPIFATPGYFRCWKLIDGRRYLHVSRSRRVKYDGYDLGWDSYPEGCILNIVVIQHANKVQHANKKEDSSKTSNDAKTSSPRRTRPRRTKG